MILRDVMESWLPRIYFGLQMDFFFFLIFLVLCTNRGKHFENVCRLKSGFSDYEAKRRKLTEAISLQYTVKVGVKTEVNCEVGERKHTHAHTLIPTHTHTHTDIQRDPTNLT